jgi:hypothetical protein
MTEHLSLRERVDAIALALHAAGIRSSDKDGLPRLVAEGVYANLRRVQRVDLCRVVLADFSQLPLAENPPNESGPVR